MYYENDDNGNFDEDKEERWEREHQFLIKCKCPICDYSYDSERYVNEGLKCPTHDCKTIYYSESYTY